ncbi:dihydropteroate synthase, partial [Dethiosulfovibrio salsuginis]
AVLGESDPANRLEATLAATALCVWQDVEIVRVHDVRENRQVIDTVWALKNASSFA